MDYHTPYDSPAEYNHTGDPVVIPKFGDSIDNTSYDRDIVKQAYGDCASYLSATYREMFSLLRESFDYVITLSDHGEMLGENGWYNHRYGLFPELTNIPLTVSGDGVSDSRCDETVSVIDVFDTIASVAGINADSRGQNLLDEVKTQDYLVEYHGLLHWHRDQFDRRNLPRRLFKTLDDPLNGCASKTGDYVFEIHGDGVRSTGEGDGEVVSRLEALREEISIVDVDDSTENISNDVRNQLEDLGYA